MDIIKMSPRATMHMSETNKKQGVSIKKKIHQKKKKCQNWKHAITEIKNSTDENNSRMERTEGRITELDDRTEETTQPKQ